MSALARNEGKSAATSGQSATVYIRRAPGGWMMKGSGGSLHYFGTSFMALQTAISAAREALAAGRPTNVMIERPDGGWRTAWSPDEPYLA